MATPRPALVLAIATATIVGLGLGAMLGEAGVEQPYAYNHAVHTAHSDCTLCHQGARSRRRAGLPGLEVCTRCHATAPGKAPSSSQQRLWKAAAEGKAPRWNRLYRLPMHVFFSHARHTTVAGIDCATCHGDMKNRRKPPLGALVVLKMRDCIQCHEKKKVSVDCTRCHR